MTRQIKPAANSTFAIAGVTTFEDTFVQGGSAVIRMSIGAKNPRHRKSTNRYRQPYWPECFNRTDFKSSNNCGQNLTDFSTRQTRTRTFNH